MKSIIFALLIALSSCSLALAGDGLTFAYVLQAEDLGSSKAKAVQKLAACDRDWIILDAFYSSEERWTQSDLKTIRDGKSGRKVVAYFSIGEAEDYRAYWNSAWKKNLPGFILEENPDWKGNYLVKYWHPQWQKIMLTEAQNIVDSGFDGFYFDKIDSFETFEHDKKNDKWIDHRKNPETKNTYREDMIAFVKQFHQLAKKQNPDFKIIPQNGSQLLEDSAYRKMADSIGIEDLFDDGEKKQKDAKYILGFLKKLSKNQPVLCVSYAEKKSLKMFVKKQAGKYGFPLLITDRDLTKLGESVAN